ncbi:hypothetical protein [Natronolimnobius baerhuensis]|uniref:DUF8054 domain-containing protein n=1 Tax=Natronolimnobius baerhuensis TaxID=253108 RepID=A0A202E8J0_9EURY|nr:hypothetical protein [Natronolimnobius baerhuensis]OVE84583.1 hypothetical protein B2G88_09290 [Natronolimnobius baerhuensis]
MESTETATLESLESHERTHSVERDAASARRLNSGLSAPAGAGNDDALASLLCATVAVDRTESGQLRLEPSFRAAWTDRLLAIRERGTRLEALAASLETDARRLELSVEPDGFVATCGRDRVGCWPSNAALLADLAAASVLETRGETWHGFDEDERGRILTALRVFLERCPNCDGEILETEPPTGSLAGENRPPANREETSQGLLPDSSQPPSPPSSDSLESRDDSLTLTCGSCGVMLVRTPYPTG